MRFAPKRPTRHEAASRPSRSGDFAYAAVEEARLVCEAIRTCDREHARGLRVLQRQLGMAGFHASSELVEIRRHELLEHARSRCDKRLAVKADVTGSLRVVARDARFEIEGALNAVGPREHLHLAHAYLLGAEELLAAWVRSNRRWTGTRAEPNRRGRSR